MSGAWRDEALSEKPNEWFLCSLSLCDIEEKIKKNQMNIFILSLTGTVKHYEMNWLHRESKFIWFFSLLVNISFIFLFFFENSAMKYWYWVSRHNFIRFFSQNHHLNNFRIIFFLFCLVHRLVGDCFDRLFMSHSTILSERI